MDIVACFGDSLVEGFPFGKDCSWCAVAETGTNFQLLNYGVCGECCDDILFRLQHTPLPQGLKGIIFLGGANDALMGRDPKNSLMMVKMANNFAKEHGLQFAVVLPLVSGDLQLNSWLANFTKLLQQEKFNFIDLQQGIGYADEELAEAYLDGVHPTAATYKAMGMVARPQIERWLCQK